MTAFKKRLLVVSALLLGSLGLITIGFEEVERKEQFARDPQGNIVASSASSEAERKTAVGSMTPEQMANKIKVEEHAHLLPRDMQKEIAGYLEEDKEDKYVLWKTLNTRANRVAFRDNGENLVSVFESTPAPTIEVVVRSMKNGAILQRFTIPERATYGNILSSDGSTIVTHTDTEIHVWNTVTGVYKSIEKSIDKVIGINDNGTILALKSRVNDQPEITLLHTENGTLTPLIIDQPLLPYHFVCAFSPDNKTVAIPSQNVIGLRNIETGDNLFELEIPNGFSGPFVSLAFNHDGTLLAVTGLESGALVLFDYKSNLLSRKGSINNISDFGSYWSSIKKFSHGSDIIALNVANNILLFDVITGLLIQQFAVNNDSGCDVAFSPDNKMLAIASKNGIQLWKKSTALQDALEKQHRVEEFRSSKGSSSSSSSSSLPASDSAGVPSVLPPMSDLEPAVEPVDNPVTMHVPSTAEPSTKASDLAMDEPE